MVHAAGSLYGQVGYTAEYSDNVGLGGQDGEEQLIHRPSVSVSVDQQGERWGLRGNYRAEERIYDDDAFDDESRVTGGAEGFWDVLPGTLRWSVSNFRAETTRTVNDLDRPDNRQVTNTFSTGPSVTFALGARDRLSAGASYTRQTADETDNSSDSLGVNASYNRQVGRRVRVGANVSVSEVDYDDTFIDDSRRSNAAATFSWQGRRLSTDLRLGYNWVEQDRGSDFGGENVGVRVGYQYARRGSVELTANRSLRDQSNQFRRLELDENGRLFEDSALTEVFESTTYGIAWATANDAFDLRASVDWRRSEYESIDRDQRRRGAQLNLSRAIGESVRLNLYGRYARFTFGFEDAVDKETEAGLRLSWNVWDKLDLAAGGSWRDRDSSNDTRDFEETRASVSLSWRFGRRAARPSLAAPPASP